MFFKVKEKASSKADLIKKCGDATYTCKGCKETFKKSEMAENDFVCPKCGKINRISARDRIMLTFDKGSFKELYKDLESIDFLSFPMYQDKLDAAKKSTDESDAVVCGSAKINNVECAVFVMDSRFIMASMGSVVGEKVTRTFEYALEHKLPVIGFTASGGARMQEGIISLMQMAKSSGAVKRHSNAGLLYVTVLTDPTTGGCTASFAMQGDIILAEENALVGFAGRRVVEQTTKTTLPDNFQTAEFLDEHGFTDSVIKRQDVRAVLADIIKIHTR